MDRTEEFNNNILNILERLSYDFYYIQRNTDVRCTCAKHETSQADPNCPICLGTGYKITVRTVHGASQDSQVPTTIRSDKFIVARNYYIPNKFTIQINDIIVDDDEMHMIMAFQKMTSFQGSIPFVKASAIKKRFDSKIARKNFYNIIERR
jgi:hypothetical protein